MAVYPVAPRPNQMRRFRRNNPYRALDRFDRPPGFGGPPIIRPRPRPPGFGGPPVRRLPPNEVGTPYTPPAVGAAAGVSSGGIGLPLSGAYEQGQRTLQDALSRQLMAIAAQRDQIAPGLELFRQRLGTEQTNAQNSLNTSLADRGVWDSTIRGTDTQNLVTGFDRARQDANIQAAQQYTDLDTAAGEAFGAFQRELQDLLLQLAGEFAENPTPAMGAGNPGATPARQGQRPRRRRRRRGIRPSPGAEWHGQPFGLGGGY